MSIADTFSKFSNSLDEMLINTTAKSEKLRKSPVLKCVEKGLWMEPILEGFEWLVSKADGVWWLSDGCPRLLPAPAQGFHKSAAFHNSSIDEYHPLLTAQSSSIVIEYKVSTGCSMIYWKYVWRFGAEGREVWKHGSCWWWRMFDVDGVGRLGLSASLPHPIFQ
jgi:hypothetical protein